MLIRCCNPDCKAPFNSREGRLIRFSKLHASHKCPEKQASVQHFWLCGECARKFVFERNPGASIKIKPRGQEPAPQEFSNSVSPA